MNELKRNVDAIKTELAKPEVVATLRMATPELYAHITAVVAVYDAYVRKDHQTSMAEQERKIFEVEMMKQRIAYDAQYRNSLLGRIVVDPPKVSVLDGLAKKFGTL